MKINILQNTLKARVLAKNRYHNRNQFIFAVRTKVWTPRELHGMTHSWKFWHFHRVLYVFSRVIVWSSKVNFPSKWTFQLPSKWTFRERNMGSFYMGVSTLIAMTKMKNKQKSIRKTRISMKIQILQNSPKTRFWLKTDLIIATSAFFDPFEPIPEPKAPRNTSFMQFFPN